MRLRPIRPRLWMAAATILLAGAALWAAAEHEGAPPPQLAAMLPAGALLYLEAPDFGSLLRDFNSSEEKKAWLTSENREAFGQSRLFTRLSQAQDEFTAAAGIPANGDLLGQVAGTQSCFALYDIGNLEFVYVTRLEQRELETTPLWQTRGKFEQRTAGGVQFFLHANGKRTAAFAEASGWLVLGTRGDLVAGVLERMQGASRARSISDEGWFASAVHPASGAKINVASDLRMVLNLDAIVPSPYFRSYWIQRNITEMKQYASAVSDLYRAPESYREQRVLVRREGLPPRASGDISTLAGMAPESAAFYSAQTSPDVQGVESALRDNLLEFKQHPVQSWDQAPQLSAAGDAGSGSDLETRIDAAPVVERATDAYLPLHTLLTAAQPDAMLQVHGTPAAADGVFARIASAAVVSSPVPWQEQDVRRALTSALAPGLTAGQLGAGWQTRQSPAGDYAALNGAVNLYLAVSGRRLLLSNDAPMLESLLSRQQAGKTKPIQQGSAVTYAAVFHHAAQQASYRALMTRLDRVGHRGRSEGEAAQEQGQSPAFFSGNVESLSTVLSRVDTETVQESDLGDKVTETVTYSWKR
ncbi:MAG TPA: hypothetical protein VGD59_07540 [Acidisarcina sp.]